jgi:16S rRNA C967 or C1407 C5-methylase (RsmB/RsmF family)
MVVLLRGAGRLVGFASFSVILWSCFAPPCTTSFAWAWGSTTHTSVHKYNQQHGEPWITAAKRQFQTTTTTTCRGTTRNDDSIHAAVNSNDDHEDHGNTECQEEEEVEEQARELAAATLRRVLLPASGNLTTEKALKQTLRSLDVSNHAVEKQQRILRRLRQRVSRLVLGTSIFRLRHEYVYNVTILRDDVDVVGESLNYTSRCQDKLRAMVDLHADYMLETENDDSNDDDSDSDTTATRSKNATAAFIPWPVHDPVQCLSLQYSMPEFLVQAWVAEYGAVETAQICQVANQPGPITFRRNAYRCPSEDMLMARLSKEDNVTVVPMMALLRQSQSAIGRNAATKDIVSNPTGCLRLVAPRRPPSIWALQAWKDGWFEVQDAGSQFIVASTEIVPGETVVDYCAGNGGKTLAMLSRLAHGHATAAVAASIGAGATSMDRDIRTTVWAHDIAGVRLAQLEGSLARVGVHPNIHLRSTDQADELLALLKADDNMADMVLVDAPCSSCGVLRRRPSHRWTLASDELTHDFPSTQLEILRQAARLVRPGGRLVYATCSISHWENEDVVAAWQETEKNWEPWAFSVPHQVGLAPHCRKLLPHKHDSDGFFMARWKRATY